MKIDVILITYNQERYVAQAVESILNQYVDGDMEVRVIVADDASTDNTLKIIRSYESKSPFPFVYLDSCPNMGHVKNYKRAFAACDGDYTFVLEGDDYWCAPHHISQHVRFLEKHGECSMSVNGIILYWEDMDEYERHEEESHKEVQYINIQQQIMENHIGNHSSACYRTNILHSVPSSIYGESFDDALLGIWFAQSGFIALLTEYSTVYRKTKSGLWTGISQQQQIEVIKSRLKANDKILNYKYHRYFKKALAQYDEVKKKRGIKSFVPKPFVRFVRNFIHRKSN